MFFILLTIIIGILIYLVFFNSVKKRCGVYSQPTIFFPLKFYIMKYLIEKRQKQVKNAQSNDNVCFRKNRTLKDALTSNILG